MSIKMRALIWLAAVTVGGCAETPPPANIGAATPQAQSMERMLADVDRLRAYAYGRGDKASASVAANDLLSWSQRMAGLFPPGKASQDYVDMSEARAAAAPGAMTRAAQSLLDTVNTADRAATGAQLERAERVGCGACHRIGMNEAP